MKGIDANMKYKVFIGSSSEHLDYAESIQLNIEKLEGIEAICWNQGVFRPGHYPLEDLLINLEEMSFGIFVLAPDDFIEIRKENYSIVRDNVILEMGMFYGALGRERTFFIAPQDKEKKLRIPSDLEGMNYATYSLDSSEDNYDQRVGSACTQIKRIIKSEIKNTRLKDVIKKYDVFPEFDEMYSNLFESSKIVTTAFIHGRRWRESNLKAINEFFDKKESHWNILLPDVENKELIKMIKNHFSDGKTMIPKIIDAYDFCLSSLKKYPDKLTVYLYSFYPTYSFYKFDNEIIIAFYPLTSERKAPPTLLLNLDLDTECNIFFKQDIEDVEKLSRKLTVDELEQLINKRAF